MFIHLKKTKNICNKFCSRFSYVMELNTSADGGVIFVLPNVLVPRYGGDINNEAFLYKQEGKLHVT